MKTFSIYPNNGAKYGDAVPFQVKGDRISANDQWMKKLWVLGNQFGVMGVVRGQGMDDAFDNLADYGLHGGILLDQEDVTIVGTSYIGNDGDPVDLAYAWAEEVQLKPGRDDELIDAFEHAEDVNADFLDAESLCDVHEGECRTSYDLGRACWRERHGKPPAPRKNPTEMSTGASAAVGAAVGAVLGGLLYLLMPKNVSKESA